MNEKDFFKEATKDMIVDLKGIDMNMTNDKKTDRSGNRSENRSRRSIYNKIAVIVIVCVISLSTIGVGASAIYHKWSNGTRDKFQVTGGDMEKYEQSGLAKFPGDESGVREVTQNGVTISVAQTIIDNYYAYVSFRIEGFDIKAGGTPGFETHHCTLDGKEVSNLSSFYVEDVLDAAGQPVIRDDELVQNYVLEDGSMEYHILLDSEGKKGFLQGKKLAVELGDLGVYDDYLDMKVDNDGTWRFEWELSGDSTSVTKETHTVLEDTGAVVTECEVSPISIRAVLDISGAKNMTSDEKYAVLSGVKLKDGTMLTDIVESGDENTNTAGEYELLFTTDRILDVNQVESLLFWKNTSGDEDGEDAQYTLNDFYEVSFN